MKTDLYGKIVLTIIALVLVVIALGIFATAAHPDADKISAGSGFVSIPLTAYSINGAIEFHAGILMVSHATGAISNCWKTCTAIGKTEPSGAQDLSLSASEGFKAYVANMATGHVVACVVETDSDVTKFKAGHCEEIGEGSR